MGKEWSEWTESEKELALQMRQEKCMYKEIAARVGKSFQAVNGFFKRYDTKKRLERRMNGEIVTNSRCLPECEHERRMKLYTDGLTDIESAKVLGLSSNSYTSWRIARGLKPNIGYPQKSHAKTGHTVVEVIQRDYFKPEHIVNYNHNNNDRLIVITPKKETCIVDIGLAEKLAQEVNARPVTFKLEERMKARLHSKELHVDAKRSFGGGGFTRVGF